MSYIHAQIIYCSFPPPVPKTKFYTCYKKETCCSQGCCLNGPYQIYQVWYYWLLFLIVFGIISGGSWLCRKPRSVQARAVREVAGSSHNSCGYPHFRCSRRRCVNNFDRTSRTECNTRRNNGNNNNNGNDNLGDYEDNIILDRLFVSFRNRNALGDPPSYSSILPSNILNIPPPKFCPLYTYYGPPPTYNSMYRMNDPQQANSNTLPNYESIVSSSADETQIQIHTDNRNLVNSGMNERTDNSSGNAAATVSTTTVTNSNERETIAPDAE
ncbi:hypothetical protein ILUMI_10862 [Ignelater luminosus]|uniref:Vesicular, overexpressed in cancer, prosurvival protein 1 n=1 Tax=Ignelater luminosus TaxID=2038154 RepID=A0A8K0D1K4_IGNLU|nr:hypothetical protein ILUMI_10862 [Ignelater luminosus]